MNILITGGNGFIAKNLFIFLEEKYRTISIKLTTRKTSENELKHLIERSDVIIHLAGVNRSSNIKDFFDVNTDLSLKLCKLIEGKYEKLKKETRILYTSTIQVENLSPYGKSKKQAEEFFIDLEKRTKLDIKIIRLPNVFGKWCKPNYNSVVATFCHNISRSLPIEINNKSSSLSLLYIDDLLNIIDKYIFNKSSKPKTLDRSIYLIPTPIYKTSLDKLAKLIKSFELSREEKHIDNYGIGLTRAMYATYLSYLPSSKFAYKISSHKDGRGSFSEIIKTNNSGQVSYFTAHKGVTRGGHFHNTKNEKFLVVKGKALFKFKNRLSGEKFQLETSDKEPVVVDTVPGWSHDITNIGNEQLVVILWANEVFDKANPDTYMYKVD